MADKRQFPYSAIQSNRGEVVLRPLLPVSLIYGGNSRQITGLLDTGADVNVLPYHLGLELGAIWSEQNCGSLIW